MDPEIQAAKIISKLLLSEGKRRESASEACLGDKICLLLEGYDELLYVNSYVRF